MTRLLLGYKLFALVLTTYLDTPVGSCALVALP